MAEDTNLELEEELEVKKPTKKKTIDMEQLEGKVFTEDYVKGLRGEAKDNRLKAKNFEDKLRKIIGLADGDVDDATIDKYLSEQEKKILTASKKADEKLILAEIKSLEGVNAKLLGKLLDRSKITIDENGTVTGLNEAVEELAKEFPEVKIATGGGGGNPPIAQKGEVEQMETDYNEAVKTGNTSLAVMLKNKLFLVKNKK